MFRIVALDDRASIPFTEATEVRAAAIGIVAPNGRESFDFWSEGFFADALDDTLGEAERADVAQHNGDVDRDQGIYDVEKMTYKTGEEIAVCLSPFLFR